MSTILDTIADYARLRVAQDAQSHSLDDLKALCRQAGLVTAPHLSGHWQRTA